MDASSNTILSAGVSMQDKINGLNNPLTREEERTNSTSEEAKFLRRRRSFGRVDVMPNSSSKRLLMKRIQRTVISLVGFKRRNVPMHDDIKVRTIHSKKKKKD